MMLSTSLMGIARSLLLSTIRGRVEDESVSLVLKPIGQDRFGFPGRVLTMDDVLMAAPVRWGTRPRSGSGSLG